MAEGERLESVCAPNGVPGVRIPLSPRSLWLPESVKGDDAQPRQVWKEAAVSMLILFSSFSGFHLRLIL